MSPLIERMRAFFEYSSFTQYKNTSLFLNIKYQVKHQTNTGTYSTQLIFIILYQVRRQIFNPLMQQYYLSMKKFDFPVVFQFILDNAQPIPISAPSNIQRLTSIKELKNRKLLHKLTVVAPTGLSIKKESENQKQKCDLFTSRRGQKTTVQPKRTVNFIDKEQPNNQENQKKTINTISNNGQIAPSLKGSIRSQRLALNSVARINQSQVRFNKVIQSYSQQSQQKKDDSIVNIKSRGNFTSKKSAMSSLKSKKVMAKSTLKVGSNLNKTKNQKNYKNNKILIDKNHSRMKRISIQNFCFNKLLNQDKQQGKVSFHSKTNQSKSVTQVKKSTKRPMTMILRTNALIKQDKMLNKRTQNNENQINFDQNENQFGANDKSLQRSFMSLRQIFHQQQINKKMLKLDTNLQEKVQKLINKNKLANTLFEFPLKKRKSIKRNSSKRLDNLLRSQACLFADSHIQFPTIKRLLENRRNNKRKMLTQFNKQSFDQQMFHSSYRRDVESNKQNIYNVLNKFRQSFQQQHLEQKIKDNQKQNYIFQTERSFCRKDTFLQRNTDFNRQTKMIALGERFKKDISNIRQIGLNA